MLKLCIGSVLFHRRCVIPPRQIKYSWHGVGLDKQTTFKLKEYVKRHDTFTEAYESAAIVELVVEALNSDAVKRNLEFVALLEMLPNLSARDPEGLRLWNVEKERLINSVG